MTEEVTFKSLERVGWEERADVYDGYTARLTNQAIEPLLDAADIEPGCKLLDVCCGSGMVSAAAVARKADVTGLDFAVAMVAQASAKGLPARFEIGDAEALPFAAQSFDRVICNFGHYHLADPDRAIREAWRVLKPGGRYAFTTWLGPAVSPIFRIIVDAIRAHGVLDVGLPPAPDSFRLADVAECERVMRESGFGNFGAAEIPSVLECPMDGLIDFLEKATVRATMLLRAQAPDARTRIEGAIREAATAHTAGGTVRMPMPSVVYSGLRT